jgi:hypothetical protein
LHLTTLLREWGTETPPKRTRAKLVVLLCVLGVLRVSAATLPRFADVTTARRDGKNTLIVPVVGYKNDTHGEGNTVVLYECSEEALCLVRTWQRWRNQTTHIHTRVQDCRIVFELQRPYAQLSPGRCASILKTVADNAGLNTAIFTARTFRKSGVIAGIQAGIEPDAILRLGGWRDQATFWRHYVVREIPSTYTDVLFDTEVNQDDSPSDSDNTSEDD